MRYLYIIIIGILTLCSSCIEPPLHLPDENMLTEVTVKHTTELKTAIGVDYDWKATWHYGWDETDQQLSGDTCYTMPTNYEVRRYYLGTAAQGKHTRDGLDNFTLFSNTFRRTFQYGYYDLLIWSNIDSDDGTQVLLVNETDLDSVKATTTVSRGMVRTTDLSTVVGLYNQPEIFYSAYDRDLYISQDITDYDYFDDKENVWVKQLNATLRPLVYIYLVQIILHNNDGRVKGVTGDAALSAMASGTCVNTGHTDNRPCMVYYSVRMKNDVDINGEKVDVIGGKLTTFGLCDMDGCSSTTSAQYAGSRTDLDNRVYYTLRFSNGTEKTYDAVVTDQCRKQCRGGVITIDIDCNQLTPPDSEDGSAGNIFVPTVEDYEHVDYDIIM